MDLTRIKNRLDKIQNSSNHRSNLWKPNQGKQQIRITPYKFDKDMPFIELQFHYGINGKSILSPLSFGNPDPIQEFAVKLQSSGNKDDYMLSRKLLPKKRTYCPIIVRGEEDKGIRFWGFGKTVYQELLSIISDPDYGDISDISNGRDITIDFKTAEELGTSFPKTLVRVKPLQTPLFEDKEVVRKWINDQVSIKEVFREESYSDMENHLNKWLNNVPSEEDEELPSISNQTEKSAEESFDELFTKSK
tara:strand:+ start:2792 stop:3535 length:744 start_codon:yes stop_codon:yes gene_type:complete